MNREEWAHYCNWDYEINQSLECFLSGSKPEGPPWWWGVVYCIALACVILVIDAINNWIKSRRDKS